MYGLNDIDAALFRAIEENDLKGVQAALDAGANVNVRGPNDTTPIHYAVVHAKEAVTALLLEHNARPNVFDVNHLSPLHNAVALKNFSMVKLLEEAGADINLQQKMDAPTPLHLALAWDRAQGGMERVHFLLERGADPNVRMFALFDNWTPQEFLEDKKDKTEEEKELIELFREFANRKMAPNAPADKKPPEDPSSGESESLKRIREAQKRAKGKYRLS